MPFGYFPKIGRNVFFTNGSSIIAGWNDAVGNITHDYVAEFSLPSPSIPSDATGILLNVKIDTRSSGVLNNMNEVDYLSFKDSSFSISIDKVAAAAKEWVLVAGNLPLTVASTIVRCPLKGTQFYVQKSITNGGGTMLSATIVGYYYA